MKLNPTVVAVAVLAVALLIAGGLPANGQAYVDSYTATLYAYGLAMTAEWCYSGYLWDSMWTGFGYDNYAYDAYGHYHSIYTFDYVTGRYEYISYTLENDL